MKYKLIATIYKIYIIKFDIINNESNVVNIYAI